MIAVAIGLIILLAFLLVLVVLAQDSKGGGLSSQFGGGASQVMGVKRTGDLLEKLTWSFMIGIMVISVSTSFMTGGEGGASSATRSVNVERAKQKPSAPAPAQSAPAAPAQGTTPAAAPAENAAPASATETMEK